MSEGLAELRDRVARLRAEAAEWRRKALDRDLQIARLTPSGQVADDERILHNSLQAFDSVEFRRRLLAALSRLTAKAQGYDAVVAEVERLRRNTREAQDYATQEVHARIAAEAERDAAVADNAALRHELDNIRPFEALHADLSSQLRDAWGATGVAGTVKGMTTLADVVCVTKADLLEALANNAALLKQMQEQEETIKALANALEKHTGAMIDGDYAAPADVLDALHRAEAFR